MMDKSNRAVKSDAANPLRGIRVLEIAQYIAGPMAGQQLADYGAEVIKVERPGSGDPFRGYAGGRNIPNYGYNFRAYNRNKQSIAVDLAAPGASELISRIAETVDVVIENFRPGVTDRLGIGYEALRAANPRLIYCAVSGFATDGPYRDRPAFDTIGQALSGMLYLFTDPRDPQMRGPTVADQVTAIQAATAVLALLRHRDATGEGGRIDVSMVDAAASFIPDVYCSYTDAQTEVTSQSRSSASQAAIMACADDALFAFQLGGLDIFARFAEELDLPDLVDDPRFNTPYDRRENWLALTEIVRPAFRKKPREHWLRRFHERGIPSSEVLSIPEVFTCPEVVHSELFETRTHDLAGETTMIRRSPRIGGSRGDRQSFAPLLGENTDTILERLGFSDAERQAMKDARLVESA